MQLMATSKDEVEGALQLLCLQAEPWATRLSSKRSTRVYDDDDDADDGDDDDDDNDDGDDDDDDDDGRDAGDVEGDGCGDSHGGGGGGGGGVCIDGKKVELSERERARTSAEKEALKAGIF
ncbi:unnamed protein product [Laminaria digitata]